MSHRISASEFVRVADELHRLRAPVVVLFSPYSCVKVGTVAKIEEIVYDHFGRGDHLYRLAGLPCKAFRAHEIGVLLSYAEEKLFAPWPPQ